MCSSHHVFFETVSISSGTIRSGISEIGRMSEGSISGPSAPSSEGRMSAAPNSWHSSFPAPYTTPSPDVSQTWVENFAGGRSPYSPRSSMIHLSSSRVFQYSSSVYCLFRIQNFLCRRPTQPKQCSQLKHESQYSQLKPFALTERANLIWEELSI